MNFIKEFILIFILGICTAFIENYNKNNYTIQISNSSINFGEMKEIKKEEILFYNNLNNNYKYNNYTVKE